MNYRITAAKFLGMYQTECIHINNKKINRVPFSKYHVYEYNINQESQRTGKDIMEFNILKTTNNNFKSEFWKQKDIFEDLQYSFHKLRNADILSK